MSDEKDKSVPNPASDEDEGDAHVMEEKSATPPSGKAHVDKDTSAPVDDTATAKEDRAKRREEGKISKLEKKLKEAETYQDQAQVYQALDRAATEDPEFGYAARKKLADLGLLDPSQVGEKPKKEEKKKEEESPEEPFPDAVSQHPAIQWAERKQAEEHAKDKKFYTDFETGKKDLVDGDPAIVSEQRRAITAAAVVNMNKGMSRKDSYEQAYLQIMHPEKLREEGELQGLVQAQATSSSIGGGVGKTAKPVASVQLTAEQLEAAGKFGMSPEEYAKWSDPNYTGEDT